MKEVGKKIREARLARKITYEKLNERTKIDVKILKAIEAGKAGHLPKTYFKGFVRTIAREVRLDPDALLREYDSRQRQLEEEHPPVQEVVPIGSRFVDTWKRQKKTVFSLLVLLFFIVLAGLYIRYGKTLFFEPKLPEVSALPDYADSTAFSSSDSTESGLFLLRMVSLKNTWVEIRLDSGMYEDMYLRKGEKSEWWVEKSIFMGLEDPKAVRLFLKGKSLEWEGGDSVSGVDLWITAEGIASQAIREKESSETNIKELEEQPPLLVGHVEEKNLLQKLPIYAQKRDLYQPNPVVLSRIERQNPSFSLICFLGTWDPLSQEIVPKLLRILQVSYLPGVSLTLIGVDQEMKDKAELVEFHRVQGVPTILFLSRGHEIGRIVGESAESLETQFLEIAQRANLILGEDEEADEDSLHEDGRNG